MPNAHRQGSRWLASPPRAGTQSPATVIHTSALRELPVPGVPLALLSSHPMPQRFPYAHLLCSIHLSDPRLLYFLPLIPHLIPDLTLPHPLRLSPQTTSLFQDTIRPPSNVPRYSQTPWDPLNVPGLSPC